MSDVLSRSNGRCRRGPECWSSMSMRKQHGEITEVAKRIVQRHQRGRPDVAAELIMRALTTSDADATFALALALTEQALDAVEDIRLDAAEHGTPWQPAVQLPSGRLITPADTSIAPIPLAMRMVDAMHRAMSGDKDAVTRLGAIYEQAAQADDATFREMFAALATYAAYGFAGKMDVLTEPAGS